MHGRPYLSFCPITLQHFQVLMSMQMDAEMKKEQIGTLFVWVGALEGGFGGWVVPQGAPPQKVDTPSQKVINTPSWHTDTFLNAH